MGSGTPIRPPPRRSSARTSSAAAWRKCRQDDRHPWRDAGEFRAVRPARVTALAPDSGSGPHHPVSARSAHRYRDTVSAHGTVDDAQGEHGVDRRTLGRPAPVGGVVEIRGTPPRRCWSGNSRRPGVRTRWRRRSRNTGRCGARSTPRNRVCYVCASSRCGCAHLPRLSALRATPPKKPRPDSTSSEQAQCGGRSRWAEFRHARDCLGLDRIPTSLGNAPRC